MIRSRITQARQQAKVIAAAVPGLSAAMIKLGVVTPDDVADDQDFFKVLRAKNPIGWSRLTGVVTITLDSAHSYTVGEVLTVSLAGYAQDYAVTITAVGTNTFSFADPEPATAIASFIEGDLTYVIKLVIKAATPVDYKIQEAIGESTVDVLMYFGIEYASQTFIALESLAMNLRTALADPANWANINDGPDDVKMEEPRLMRKDNSVPGYYKITLTFNGV